MGERGRKAVRVAVDARLLARARKLKLNLSTLFDAAVAQAIRRREGEAWLKRNRAALEAYNRHVENDGVFSEALRSF
jgi:antitoxin CcdA